MVVSILLKSSISFLYNLSINKSPFSVKLKEIKKFMQGKNNCHLQIIKFISLIKN